MRKKNIAIIAPTGMLGNAVYLELYKKYHLVLLYRNKAFLSLLPDYEKHTLIHCDLAEVYQDYKKGFTGTLVGPALAKIISQMKNVGMVINCAGITKPHALENPELTFFINGAFPHILSEIYKQQLIQIATDCVFDGTNAAPYAEDASKLPADLYGLSKSLGEPFEKSLVLRTSIIGEELHGHSLLISWLRKQQGEVSGFTNHFWNGITTRQFAKICDEIISKRNSYSQHGLFHIFSNDITKYDLLCLLKEKYNLSINIKKVHTEKADRRLRSNYSLCTDLGIPPIEKMLMDM